MRRTCPAHRTARLASCPSASAAAPRKRGRDRHSDPWLHGPAEVWHLAGGLARQLASRFRHGTTYPGPSGAGDLNLQTDTRTPGRHGRRKRYRRAMQTWPRLAKVPDPAAGCPGAVGSCRKGGSSRTARSSIEKVLARERVLRRVLAQCRPTSCMCPACAVAG